MNTHDKVSIRPQVSMLSVLKYLEYETWFALAEFVDNSIVSYLNNEKDLKNIHGEKFKLEVKIELSDSENKITIRDNAAGINEVDYPRAFRPAEVPPDNTGLSEFGMGMKSAACWFSDEWRVSTTALGEIVTKVVNFDMKKIFEDKIEELDVEIKHSNKNSHYTTIELFNVNKMPRVKGLHKVKEHLKGIYRDFIRREVLILKVNEDELYYKEPKILKAARYDDVKGAPILWKKEIDFPIEENLSVNGFVAIRETGSTSEAGFALFRRGRVIEGSFDKGFKPEKIFGSPNSFRYQRLFGELHLEGFNVNFTKKGVQWDENLDIFLDLLKDDLSHEDFPLLQQAEKYRVRATETEYKAATKVLDSTVEDLEKKVPQAIADTLNAPKIEETEQPELTQTDKTIHRDFEVRFNKVTWKITIELSYDLSLTELIEVANYLVNQKTTDSTVRQIGIRLSLTHPFMVSFVGVDKSKIEPILRFVAALGLSEVIAKESGVKTQGEVRRNFNELISNLSKSE